MLCGQAWESWGLRCLGFFFLMKNAKRGVLSLIGEDEDTAIKICTNLTKKFTDDEEYLQKELKNALPRVQCLELIPEHMTGKLVNES